MSSESLRFVHAAHLRLGAQITERCRIPKAQRDVALDASLRCLRNLVDVAVQNQVEFLLLTGQSFDDDQLDIRSEQALTDAIERLDRQNIRVFVLPDSERAATIWRQASAASNLTLLDERNGTAPTAVVRGGRLIASLITGADHQLHQAASSTETGAATGTSVGHEMRRAFRIGVTSQAVFAAAADNERQREATASTGFNAETTAENWAPHRTEITESAAAFARDEDLDYLAGHSDERQRTARSAQTLVHAPGICLPLCFQEAGGGEVTLVEFTPDGEMICRDAAVSSLEWVEHQLKVNQAADLSSLEHAMLRSLKQDAGQSPQAVLRFVRWHLSGPQAGELFRDRQAQSRLATAINQRLHDSNAPSAGVPVIHSWRLQHQTVRRALSPLGEEFLTILRSHKTISTRELSSLLGPAQMSDEQLQSLLHELLPRMHSEHIAERVEQYGAHWFARPSEQGAA